MNSVRSLALLLRALRPTYYVCVEIAEQMIMRAWQEAVMVVYPNFESYKEALNFGIMHIYLARLFFLTFCAFALLHVYL